MSILAEFDRNALYQGKSTILRSNYTDLSASKHHEGFGAEGYLHQGKNDPNVGQQPWRQSTSISHAIAETF